MKDAGKALVTLARGEFSDHPITIALEHHLEPRFVPPAAGKTPLVTAFIIKFVRVLHGPTSLSADLEDTR